MTSVAIVLADNQIFKKSLRCGLHLHRAGVVAIKTFVEPRVLFVCKLDIILSFLCLLDELVLCHGGAVRWTTCCLPSDE